jgi:hypothetical protein
MSKAISRNQAAPHLGDRVRVTPMGGGAALEGALEARSTAWPRHRRSRPFHQRQPAAQREPDLQLGAAGAAQPVRIKLDPAAAGRTAGRRQTVTVQVLENKAPGRAISAPAPQEG